MTRIMVVKDLYGEFVDAACGEVRYTIPFHVKRYILHPSARLGVFLTKAV